MTVINEKIIVSKYKAYHTLFTKKIDFSKYDRKIKNIIHHKELIKEIKCSAAGDHVDIRIKLDIYYTYSIEENGEYTDYSAQSEEDIFLRVYKSDFKPVPYETDFKRCELTANIRNIKTIFDISIENDIICINSSAFVIVNLFREKNIEVGNLIKEDYNESVLNQVAMSSESDMKDFKDYFNNIENYSKVISKRIDELEEENNFYREELKRMENELSRRTEEYLGALKKSEDLEKEFTRLTDRLKEIDEKYYKEQKKANLLEIENSRNMDELKILRKEKTALLQKIDKNKVTFKDRLKKIIGSEDKK